MLRVFHDRLTDEKDRLWIGHLTCEILDAHFKEKASRILGVSSSSDQNLLAGMRGLLFADFLTPGADPKLYKCAHTSWNLLCIAWLKITVGVQTCVRQRTACKGGPGIPL